MFNMVDFLDGMGAKQYNENNYTMACPKCGKDKDHFQISIDPGHKVAHCFKCGYRTSWIGLVSYLKKISYEEAREIVEVFVFSKKEEKKKEYHPFYMPVASLWPDDALEYLFGRGLNESDIRDRNVFYTSYRGKYQNRIIFPVALDGVFQALQARSLNENPRYLSSSGITRFLYGYDNLFEGEEAFLVEGIFDQIAMEKAGYNTVATFSKKISQDQIDLLLNKKISRVILTWDEDAYQETIKAYHKLGNYFDVRITPMVDKDPGECKNIHYMVSGIVDCIDDFMNFRMSKFAANLT